MRVGYILVLALILLCTGCGQDAPEVGASRHFPLNVQWTYQSKHILVKEPLYAEGEVYVVAANQRTIEWFGNEIHFALDAETGNHLWKRELEDTFTTFDYQRAVVTDRLILSGSRKVMAIDLESGDIEWEVDGFEGSIALAVAGNMVFVAAKGDVTALDVQSGKRLWQIDNMPRYTFRVLYDKSTDRLIVPDQELILLEPQTGRILDTRSNQIDCSPYVLRIHEGNIYCTSGRVYDSATGRLIFDDKGGTNDLTWVADTLYFRTEKGTVKAVDTATHKLKWEYVPSAEDGNTRPKAISNIATVASNGYVIVDDATLRAFDLETGKEVGWWQGPGVVTKRHGEWKLRTDVDFGLTSDGKQLFVTFGDHDLYTFGY